jgi:hypothetical protein
MSLALASGTAVGDGAEEDAGASVGIGCDAGSLVGVGASSRFLAQATRSRAARAKASRKNVTELVFLRVKIFRYLASRVCLSMLHQG